jgi:transcriptional antiterminator NusG
VREDAGLPDDRSTEPTPEDSNELLTAQAQAAPEGPESSAESGREKSAEGTRQKVVKPVREEPVEEAKMDWYILKVQSNRENSICDGLRRRVAIAGLDEYFGEILVPTEDVAEFKNGKRRIVKRKLYPGYIVVHMVLNDETWFVVRETPGIGDFTGAAGKPSPMRPHEVERIVRAVRPKEEGAEPIKTAIPYKSGDRVRIKEGTFENFEGDVEGIDEANGRVTVMINIFGRSTPVELEHWQVESV